MGNDSQFCTTEQAWNMFLKGVAADPDAGKKGVPIEVIEEAHEAAAATTLVTDQSLLDTLSEAGLDSKVIWPLRALSVGYDYATFHIRPTLEDGTTLSLAQLAQMVEAAFCQDVEISSIAGAPGIYYAVELRIVRPTGQ